MNKYIKKCIIIYSALTLVLVGMAGVTYAITATDADQYVTRSQYAVDMAYLQNKLDEAEAGLLGNINRFRSTDVKMVTWDTPTRQAAASGSSYYNQGKHNGGNYFPRVGTNTSNLYGYGYGDTNAIARKKEGSNTSYSMYRLWNGNYYFHKDMAYRAEAATNDWSMQPLVSYALPIESHPGWYLIIKLRLGRSAGVVPLFSIVKLDPTSTTPMPMAGNVMTVRFKKDLFVYSGTGVTPITTTKDTRTVGCEYYQNTSENGAFAETFSEWNRQAKSGNVNVTTVTWLDDVTGDYMMTISCGSTMASGEQTAGNYFSRLVHWNAFDGAWGKLIPKDNVEYMIGNTLGYLWSYGNHTSPGTPNPARLGTGTGYDGYWEYEFVDCENGIKYWHAYRPPRTAALPSPASGDPLPYGIHFCLPIVY